MSNILKTSSCKNFQSKCLSGSLFDSKEEKDLLIDKLNSRIKVLEQNDKDYNLLNEEYRQLKNDFDLLTDEKFRLEYEIKQLDDAFNKKACNLEGENENYHDGLNDKMCVNRKLFEEKKCLENQLRRLMAEINDIKNRLDELNSKFNSLQGEKKNLQTDLNDLNENKQKQKDKIAKLVDDNRKLCQLYQDQDRDMFLAEQEKQKLYKKLNDDKACRNNLNNKVNMYEKNLNNLQRQLNNDNEIKTKLKEEERELEGCLAELQGDKEKLKKELGDARKKREDECKKNEELRSILNDRQSKLRNLKNDYLYKKNVCERIDNERNMYKMENENLREHILALNKINQNLSKEIENVLKEDEKMKNILNRSERMSSLLKNNESILSQMPEEFFSISTCYEENNNNFYPSRSNFSPSRSGKKERSFSPQYTYQMKQNL